MAASGSAEGRVHATTDLVGEGSSPLDLHGLLQHLDAFAWGNGGAGIVDQHHVL